MQPARRRNEKIESHHSNPKMERMTYRKIGRNFRIVAVHVAGSNDGVDAFATVMERDDCCKLQKSIMDGDYKQDVDAAGRIRIKYDASTPPVVFDVHLVSTGRKETKHYVCMTLGDTHAGFGDLRATCVYQFDRHVRFNKIRFATGPWCCGRHTFAQTSNAANPLSADVSFALNYDNGERIPCIGNWRGDGV